MAWIESHTNLDRHLQFRRDGLVVEGAGLENRCGRKLTGGSNPSPSEFKDNKKTKWLGLNLIQIWIVILN